MCFSTISSNENDFPQRQIRIGARRLCQKPGFYYDYELDVCVMIDKSEQIMPELDECPDGSFKNGYYCEGVIISDMEEKCPKKYQVNFDNQCIKVIVYTPKPRVCPDGFYLRKRNGRQNVDMCIQDIWTNPMRIAVNDTVHTRINDDVYQKCKSNKKKSCPKYHHALPDETPYILKCPDGAIMKQHKSKKMCLYNKYLPPENEMKCIDGYYYYKNRNLCLMMKMTDVQRQCPYPNADIGPGFGDWETPKYKYDPLRQCVAKKALAGGARCPPGYQLTGRFKPVCHKKLFMPFQYDCNHLQGFAFRWDDELQVGVCEYTYDSSLWKEGANYLSAREKSDNKRARFKQTPYDVQDSYELFQSLKDAQRNLAT